MLRPFVVFAMFVLIATMPSRTVAARNIDQGLAHEESDISALNADVVSVVSRGEWQAAGRSGFYRLVVVSGGYEHVTSRLYVQWVEMPRDSSTPSRVVRTKDALGASLFSLGVPVISRVQGKWQATVEGSDSYTQPSRRGRWVLILGPPGDVQVREIR